MVIQTPCIPILAALLLTLLPPAKTFKTQYFPLHHGRPIHKETQLELYRKFHERGWATISIDGPRINEQIATDLQTNSSPVKNTELNVVAEIRSLSTFPFLDSLSPNESALRLARSAFLETQTSTNEASITPMTIHVLNFVLFPNYNIRQKNDVYFDLPIFGADIVSLPGNKHLVAIDFQPVLPLKDNTSFLPEKYSEIESKLKDLKAKYQEGDDALLPWGGDIPSQAKRFFSPYTLWTRLSDDDAIEKVDTIVWNAFQEYYDLYLELITLVQKDLLSGKLEISRERGESNNLVRQGQVDYLEYRRANDPARPMLQRLYGEDWTERVIAEVLFPDLS